MNPINSQLKEQAVASNSQQPTIAEVTFSPFQLIWRALLSIGLIWFLACAIQIAYVRHNEIDPKQHFDQLLDYYGNDIPDSSLAARSAEKAYWMIFSATPSQREFFRIRITKDSETPLSERLKRGINSVFRIDIQTIAYTTLLVAIKLGILLSALVSWSIVLGVALVDGWCQRYVRTTCGGNESATVYHTAKLWSSRMIPLSAAIIFLCFPTKLDLSLILVPAMLLITILLQIRATYYKKYL